MAERLTKSQCQTPSTKQDVWPPPTISRMDKDVDGDTNGASTVGWDNHYAMNMMRLNDGYKGIGIS